MVHQLFTSEDADPGVMARVGPQRERFPPPRTSGRCWFGQRTFAGRSGNDEDAPKAAICIGIVELAGSIRKLSSNHPGKVAAPFVTRGFPR